MTREGSRVLPAPRCLAPLAGRAALGPPAFVPRRRFAWIHPSTGQPSYLFAYICSVQVPPINEVGFETCAPVRGKRRETQYLNCNYEEPSIQCNECNMYVCDK